MRHVVASTQSGKFRPWTLIWSYVGLVVLLYGLVFLTPGSNSMKLGIDLQGGTRVTLQAKTADGTAPTRESMQQARTIMETRVNGSGVVGAQVQLDGASQLVVTVPGQKDLGALTRAAKLNIRPVEGSPVPIGLSTEVPSSESSSGPSTSGTVPSATSSASEEPAIGDTVPETSTASPVVCIRVSRCRQQSRRAEQRRRLRVRLRDQQRGAGPSRSRHHPQRLVRRCGNHRADDDPGCSVGGLCSSLDQRWSGRGRLHHGSLDDRSRFGQQHPQ